MGCRPVRYVTSDTWRQLRAFDLEAKGIPMRHQQRRLVLLAAFCGSPASQTGEAIGVDPSLILRVGRGACSIHHPRKIERLHDWIKASLWRHLWRIGSESACGLDAVIEARTHAASVCEIPREWLRDWRIAAEDVVR